VDDARPRGPLAYRDRRSARPAAAALLGPRGGDHPPPRGHEERVAKQVAHPSRRGPRDDGSSLSRAPPVKVEWRGIRVANWHRPMSYCMRALLDRGFALARFDEPAVPDPATPKEVAYNHAPYQQIMEQRVPDADGRELPVVPPSAPRLGVRARPGWVLSRNAASDASTKTDLRRHPTKALGVFASSLMPNLRRHGRHARTTAEILLGWIAVRRIARRQFVRTASTAPRGC
jgi:hypothetical protein